MIIISKFRDRPKTATGRLAFWLGLASLGVFPALGTSAALLVPAVARSAGEAAGRIVGVAVAAAAFLLSVAAVTVAVRAYRLGERSWATWFGLVPALFVALSWVALVVGEFAVPH